MYSFNLKKVSWPNVDTSTLQVYIYQVLQCAQNENQPAVNICLFIHVNILNFSLVRFIEIKIDILSRLDA